MEQFETNSEIKWNDQTKLIISDVDETVADLYRPASPEMCEELSQLLEEGKSMVFITGQSLESVERRLLNSIDKPLRKNILVGHCNGAEVFGHDQFGNLRKETLYSVYETLMTHDKREVWRDQVNKLIDEFKLKVYKAMPVKAFFEQAGDDPLAMMIEDRGSQITFEMINAYNLTEKQVGELPVDVPRLQGRYDLRLPILERAGQLFEENDIPMTPRLGGMFAVDFAVKDTSKKTVIDFLLNDTKSLSALGLSQADLENPEKMEVWGDRFSTSNGSDWHMSRGLPKEVRSITFRAEDSKEFLLGYNTVIWDGRERLHDGLLEYLRSRKRFVS